MRSAMIRQYPVPSRSSVQLVCRCTDGASGWRGCTIADREVAEAEFAHESAHDDERKEHPEQQIEQVVAGVDRREAHAERNAYEELAFACELESACGLELRPPKSKT